MPFTTGDGASENLEKHLLDMWAHKTVEEARTILLFARNEGCGCVAQLHPGKFCVKVVAK